VRIGFARIFVQDEVGDYKWRDPAEEDTVRTFKFSTDQFTAANRLRQGRSPSSKAIMGPTLRTTIDWDPITGGYQLSRVELGLFGKTVWLVHQPSTSADESGTIGIQLNISW